MCDTQGSRSTSTRGCITWEREREREWEWEWERERDKERERGAGGGMKQARQNLMLPQRHM
jgi:hypothetical protein